MAAKKIEYLKIKILNWDKYQADRRKNSKAKKFTWWARSNDFSQDDKMKALGSTGRDVFCALLDVASTKNNSEFSIALRSLQGRITLGLGMYQVCRGTVLRECLAYMQDIGIIEYDFTHNITEHKSNITEEEPDALASGKAFGSVSPPPGTQKKRQAKKSLKPKKPALTSPVWEQYKMAYVNRYGTEPIRSAKQNGILTKIIAQVGAEEATGIVKFFVEHNAAWYVQRAHPLDSLIADLQKILVEFRTGRMITRKQAEATETTSANKQALQSVLASISLEDKTYVD